MDKLTNIVRDEISRQYKSVRQFAFAVGIPLSTINSALRGGYSSVNLSAPIANDEPVSMNVLASRED